jgi:hypothetical protein
MDSTSLAYNFPLYYQAMYSGGGLADFEPGISQIDEGTVYQDLTLAEYTVAHKLRMEMKSLVNGVQTFLSQRNDCKNEINEELSNYQDTSSIEDPNLFDNLLTFLVSNSEEFVIQLGEGFSLTPTYVHNLKKTYLSSTTLQNNVLFRDMLDLNNPDEDLYRTVTLTPKFIAMMHTSLLGGVIEKLSANFKGSEFVIAFNLCILQCNAQAFGLADKLVSIASLAEYLSENCTYCQEDVTQLLEDLQTALDNFELYTNTGTVNFDPVWNELEEYQVARINRVRRAANVIIGTSLTEIESKINLNKLLMYNVCFPAIER